MDNEKVKRQVALLAAGTQRVLNYFKVYRVRLDKLISICLQNENLDLKMLTTRSMIQNNVSTRDLLRLNRVISGYSLPGAGRAIFYPTIYFPYLDTSIRGAQTAWDGVSIDYVSVGSLFEYKAAYPSFYFYKINGSEKINSVELPIETIMKGRLWNIVFEDNIINDFDYYRIAGGECFCDCSSNCRPASSGQRKCGSVKPQGDCSRDDILCDLCARPAFSVY
jgi:hypothetical protein